MADQFRKALGQDRAGYSDGVRQPFNSPPVARAVVQGTNALPTTGSRRPASQPVFEGVETFQVRRESRRLAQRRTRVHRDAKRTKMIRYTLRPDGMLEAIVSGDAGSKPDVFIYKKP